MGLHGIVVSRTAARKLLTGMVRIVHTMFTNRVYEQDITSAVLLRLGKLLKTPWRRFHRFLVLSHRISRLKTYFSETQNNLFETKRTKLVQKKRFLGIEGCFSFGKEGFHGSTLFWVSKIFILGTEICFGFK